MPKRSPADPHRPPARRALDLPSTARTGRLHRRRSVRIVLAWLIVLAWVPAAGAARLKNIAPTPHGIAAGTDLERIGDALILAADEVGWSFYDRGKDSVTVTIKVRNRHGARVRIGFDAKNFWIDYEDSVNLDFDPKDRFKRRANERYRIPGPFIHGNYNVWVQNLAYRIERRAEEIAQSDARVEDVLPVADAGVDEPGAPEAGEGAVAPESTPDVSAEAPADEPAETLEGAPAQP